jgi:hypothetical protein
MNKCQPLSTTVFLADCPTEKREAEIIFFLVHPRELLPFLYVGPGDDPQVPNGRAWGWHAVTARRACRCGMRLTA